MSFYIAGTLAYQPRHVRKYGCAAQPVWHVRVRCRTTSMYIDPGFAQLLASYHLIQFNTQQSILSFSSVESSRGFFPYILAPDVRPTTPRYRRETDDDQRPTERTDDSQIPKKPPTKKASPQEEVPTNKALQDIPPKFSIQEVTEEVPPKFPQSSKKSYDEAQTPKFGEEAPDKNQ